MIEDSVAVRLALLEANVTSLVTIMEERDKKLDELLTLKHRGMGAIWLASLIFGSSLLAAVATLISWIRS